MTVSIVYGRQQGFLLLDGLIAILIFSMGILALVGMQATSIKHVSDAKFRVDASYLANQVIGQMWVDDNAALASNYNSPSGTRYVAWRTEVQSALPGASVVANYPTIAVDANNVATVTVYWQPSPASPVHNFVAIAQVRK